MKHHMRYTKQGHTMEYKCHFLQLSKIFGEKTNAHHNVVNITEE